MEGDIDILDGLVKISGEPYVEIELVGSRFRRWTPAEIARHQKLEQRIRRWRRWRWLPLPLQSILGAPPRVAPPNRSVRIAHCQFDGGDRTAAGMVIVPEEIS